MTKKYSSKAKHEALWKAGPGRKSWRLHRSPCGGRGTISATTVGPQAEPPHQARGLGLYPEDTQAREGAQLSRSSGWSGGGGELEAGTLDPECSSGLGHRPEALRRMTRGLAKLKEHPGPGGMDSVSRCSPRSGLGCPMGAEGQQCGSLQSGAMAHIPQGCLGVACR